MPFLSRATISGLSAVSIVLGLATAASAEKVDFPTSCSAKADTAFDEGLTLLHNMMYIQAEEAFNRSALEDPKCAMAQWGIAMSNFHPLWPGVPTEQETARGREAAVRLAELEPGSPIEADFVVAAAAFYDGDQEGYQDRVKAWAEAQISAAVAHPDNVDAVALAALARLSSAPRGPERMDVFASVGDALDKMHNQAPDHPGVIHYAIHAYDNPLLKARGVPYAEIYDITAPDAPHALHMPAHIFTRTGDWEKSIDLNRRSAEAALAQSGDILQSHYAHAIDYMVYGYLQKGQPGEAEALVEEMLAKTNHQVSFGGAFALAASPVRLLLEQDKWAEAAALSPDLHPGIPWDRFPQTVTMLWFAKGIGAARSGDIEGARNAVSELSKLQKAIAESGQTYWSQLTEGQIMSVTAWIEHAEGNETNAVSLQRKAAELEDEIGKSPVTPGHVLPARELLADLYSELGRTDDAKEAYLASLASSPNRARALAALD